MYLYQNCERSAFLYLTFSVMQSFKSLEKNQRIIMWRLLNDLAFYGITSISKVRADAVMDKNDKVEIIHSILLKVKAAKELNSYVWIHKLLKKHGQFKNIDTQIRIPKRNGVKDIKLPSHPSIKGRKTAMSTIHLQMDGWISWRFYIHP